MTTHTTAEVANYLGVSTHVIRHRAKMLNIQKLKKQIVNQWHYVFTDDDIFKLKHYKIASLVFPEIIYVTRQTDVYNSISNNWSEKKINKVIKEYEQN